MEKARGEGPAGGRKGNAVKTIIAIIAATLAVPAAAQPETAPRTPAIAAPAQAGGAAAAKKETRYCVDRATTGSRIKRRTCLTRDVWMEQGVDPLEGLKR